MKKISKDKADNKSRIADMFGRLSIVHKIELIVALAVSVGAVIGIPVYAWFAYQRQLAELQMIKTPDLLYLTAANAEAVINLKMSGINVSATKKVGGQDVPITSKMYPFCVAGDYVSMFTLQLAHTSNNPFKYKIYEGIVYTNPNDAASAGSGEYVEYTVTQNFAPGLNVSGLDVVTDSQVIYIVKGNEVSGRYLNMSGDNRTATNRYLEECYGNEDGNYTNFTDYELALYWQSNGIQSVPDPTNHGDTFFKTFIIEVSWDNTDATNEKYKKETDIVYLMAFTGA